MLLRMAFGGNLRGFAERTEGKAKQGAMNGARRFRTVVKLRFRDDVRQGGLGDRLANTWREDLYPKGSKASLHPAVHVYSKAPQIIRAHTDGVTIRGRGGNYLAIPTEKTPRRGRRLATPNEVEAMFNQDLVIFEGRGRTLLAFIDVALAKKSGRSFRDRRGRFVSGKKSGLVLMFVLTPQVGLRKRLNWPAIANDLGAVWLEYIAEETARSLAS